MAGTGGLQGFLHRMELLRAGEEGDAEGQEAAAADADDVLPDPQRRFCRPLRAPDPAAAARGLHRALRPLLLHGVRARHHARLQPGMGPEPLQFRREAGHHVLVPRAAGGGAGPHPRRAAEAEAFRGGHGHAAGRQRARELRQVPGAHPPAIRAHVHQYGFTVMDASQPIETQQQKMRQIIGERIDLPAFKRRSKGRKP